MWNVQTPQIFEYHLIKEAYEKALMHDSSRITDDAMVVEDYGNHEVWLYEGSYKNIKLLHRKTLKLVKYLPVKHMIKKVKKMKKVY